MLICTDLLSIENVDFLLMNSINFLVSGVLEINCPYSIVNEIPSAENLPYLEMSGGSERLKENHAYFDQIQGQMVITKRNWCYFYDYTQKGQYI